jgi:hypothetical protein
MSDNFVPSQGPTSPDLDCASGCGMTHKPEFDMITMFDNGAVRDGNTGAMTTRRIGDD